MRMSVMQRQQPRQPANAPGQHRLQTRLVVLFQPQLEHCYAATAPSQVFDSGAGCHGGAIPVSGSSGSSGGRRGQRLLAPQGARRRRHWHWQRGRRIARRRGRSSTRGWHAALRAHRAQHDHATASGSACAARADRAVIVSCNILFQFHISPPVCPCPISSAHLSLLTPIAYGRALRVGYLCHLMPMHDRI